MPFVSGYLRLRKRPGRPGHPGQPLPPEIDEDGDVDPDYGIDVGDRPPFEKPLPKPPPGIWPPPTVEHPIEPVPPGIDLPPGTIWPLPGDDTEVAPPIAMPSKKLVLLAWVPGYGFKYIVVDPSLRPQPKK